MPIEPLAVEASFTADALRVRLADGGEVSAPREWFSSLRDASEAQRRNWRSIGGGVGLHWPDLESPVATDLGTLLLPAAELGRWAALILHGTPGVHNDRRPAGVPTGPDVSHQPDRIPRLLGPYRGCSDRPHRAGFLAVQHPRPVLEDGQYSFQAPVLAKRVEAGIAAGPTAESLADFRWLLAAASLATVVGALLTPMFQRLFTAAVLSFSRNRSLPRLLLRALSPAGLALIREAAVLPAKQNVALRMGVSPIGVGVVLTNVVATGVWTVGVFAALYAGYLAPDLRATASNLSGVVNGAATILLFAVVGPSLAVLTDDVAGGQSSETDFRRAVVWMLGSRLAGTVLAQVLLLPAAYLIATVARSL